MNVSRSITTGRTRVSEFAAATPARDGSLAVADGLVVREGVYAPGERIRSHAHDWAFIALVVEGTVEEVCARERDVRGRGAVRIMPAGVEHANAYRADGARCLICEIHGDARELFSRSCGVLETAEVHAPGSPVSAVANRIDAEYRQRDDLSPLAIDGLLRELLVAAARHGDGAAGSGVMPPWIRRVRDRLHDEFPRAPSLRSLADGAGVHPSHLVRAFRRHFHRAPAEYVTHLRIERARSALAASREPISEIALSLGFSDQAHFTRRFRAATGTTPARYRAERRG